MSYSIEEVVGGGVLGEGPHWDITAQALYFIDAASCTIHKYKPSTKEHTHASLDISPSIIIPIEGSCDKFLITLMQSLAIITWDGVSNVISNIKKVAEIEAIEDPRGIRLNDGKVDFTGKLWTGSVIRATSLNEDFPRIGKIFSLNKNLQLKSHVEGIQVSNGMAWNQHLKKFYYIDSLKRTIDEFDYDVENEMISNCKSVFTLDKHNIDGLPDGQAIDADGNLWIALFNGSKVIKIDPRVPETLLQTIEIPAKQVTSIAFGGENLDELYVTSARGALGDTAPVTPADGATFRITGLGVKGFGGTPFVLEQSE